MSVAPRLAPDFLDATGSCIVIGGGLAGLSAALAMAPRRVILIARDLLCGESSSELAQGGIAASVGPDDDLLLHLADTLKAGAGLCDEEVARAILAAAPAAIETLARLGAPFDRDGAGNLLLGLEAAHSRRRIVHAGGDSSGGSIMRALVRRVEETRSITVLEGAATRLLVEENEARGVLVHTRSGPVLIASALTLIATGGLGGLFKHGTNPAGSIGQGLALAAHAGAVMADLEFVQFHPTALDAPSHPLKLISETVRGEGAILIDDRGDRFMADEPGAELAPRDIVSRAVWRRMSEGRRVFLDARAALGQNFARRFPAIAGFCAAAGIDPATQPIPIRPAAHYHMGGIAVDLNGRTSVEGLWACGEAACTGLHGANRLASNSLLEAVVCGGLAAESMGSTTARGRRNPSRAAVLVPRPGPAPDPSPVRAILSSAAGVLREEARLREAAEALYPLAVSEGAASDPALVGLMIVISALRRRESRGAHARTDFPALAPEAKRSALRLADALEAARERAPEMAL